MIKVEFKVSHPEMTFEQVQDAVKTAHKGCTYAAEMNENVKKGAILHRFTENQDGAHTHYTIWKDEETLDEWRARVYSTPSLKQYYDNLDSLGLTWSITRISL
jgi:hypothetical protein